MKLLETDVIYSQYILLLSEGGDATTFLTEQFTDLQLALVEILEAQEFAVLIEKLRANQTRLVSLVKILDPKSVPPTVPDSGSVVFFPASMRTRLEKFQGTLLVYLESESNTLSLLEKRQLIHDVVDAKASIESIIAFISKHSDSV